MNARDLVLAAAIAAGVYLLAVKLARGGRVRDPSYVPTGFEWSYTDGAYVKLGADGTKYRYV